MRWVVVVALVLGSACSSGDDASTPSPEATASPASSVEATPTADPMAPVRAFIGDFMTARLDRDASKSRSFLGPAAASQYDDGTGGLTLIGTSNRHFDSWELLSLQRADANSFEVQVEITQRSTGSDDTSTFEETLFVGPGTDVDDEQRPYVVRGAEQGVVRSGASSG